MVASTLFSHPYPTSARQGSMNSTLLSVAQAGERLRSLSPAPRSEKVPLSMALGRVLTREIRADRDLPPYDRVCVDGYALRWSDWHAGLRDFRIAGSAQAGAPRHAAPGEGECLEVMTGAVLPEGCDAVVRLEEAMWAGEGMVHFEKVQPNRDVHTKGRDALLGQPVLHAMTRLGAAEIAVLASVGCQAPEVRAFPRVAVMATGDELVAVADTPLPHQIRRSNDHFLAASLQSMGFPPPTRIQVPDCLETMVEAMEATLRQHDVLLVTGGVSVSRRDVVPEALERAGVKPVFHKVAQRPGKPLWCGLGPQEQLVAALPGNPVAASVCFARHVRPLLCRTLGLPESHHPVRLGSPLECLREMTRFVPCRLRDDGAGCRVAHPVEGNGSGDFLHLAGTDGFLEIPPGTGILQPGSVARFHPW